MLTLLRKLKNPFADIPVEDRKVILVCLGIAFIFWLLLKLSKEYSVVQHVQISYDLPLGKNFKNTPPTATDVELKSTGWYFLRQAIFGRNLSLSYPVPDEATYNLSYRQLRADIQGLVTDNDKKDVSILNLFFIDYYTDIELQAKKKLPVVVPQRVHLNKEQAALKKIKISPDSILIVGPASQLAQLHQWPTDSLVLEHLDKTYEGKLQLQTPDNGLYLGTKEVKVELGIEQYTEKQLKLPIQVDASISDSIRFFPAYITLNCTVGFDNYEDLSADDFVLKAIIDQDLIRTGSRNAVVRLIQQPKHIKNPSLSHRQVQFVIITP